MKNARQNKSTDFILPISSVNDVIKIQAETLIDFSSIIDEQKLPLVTYGILDFDFSKSNSEYSYIYNVPLKDPTLPSNVIALDIPKSLIDEYRLTGGEIVKVIGYLRVNIFNNVFSMRLRVIGIDLDTSNQVLSKSNKSFADFFKHLTIYRVSFPLYETLKIAIITPRNGDAFADLTKQIKYNSDLIEIVKYPTNMASKDDLLDALNKIQVNAVYNVVAIVRGGGATHEFNIFDDIQVCERFAGINCHKIIGLGHDSNRSLLELVTDHSLQTPTAVGSYINTNIQKLMNIKDDFISEELSSNNLKHQNVIEKAVTSSYHKQNIIYICRLLIAILSYLVYSMNNEIKKNNTSSSDVSPKKQHKSTSANKNNSKIHGVL